MKMKLFTLGLALFTTLYTFAQEEKVNSLLSEPKVQVVESIETMSKGDNNSFTMTFTGINAKDLRNEWNKHLKTVCDKSKTAKDDEIYSANSTITGLPQTINIYSQVKELTKESAEVIAFF